MPPWYRRCSELLNLGARRQLGEIIVLQELIQWGNALETGTACFHGQTAPSAWLQCAFVYLNSERISYVTVASFGRAEV